MIAIVWLNCGCNVQVKASAARVLEVGDPLFCTACRRFQVITMIVYVNAGSPGDLN